jgi:ABC-type antimicrobial peptide transport system permease subunit
MAAIGIYGVMAYSVEQRRQEIGIRMALGASPRMVRHMILRAGALLTITGTVIGVSSALALTRLLAGFLFEVRPLDPIAFVAVVLLLGAIALLAAYVPSRRAMRVDPMVALRPE